MGLLDDAIREHLDLKRRRGADPTEVQRAEHEALGPVRRGPEALEQIDPRIGDSFLHGEGRQHWGEPAAEGADGFAATRAAEPDGYGSQPTDEEPLRTEASPSGQTRLEQGGQIDDATIDSHEPEPDAHGATPPPHPAPAPFIPEQHEAAPAEETAEYEVESSPPVERDDNDDMLEETPEFLQDTPDHDRLWFEQRPPRDFDFDG